MVAVTVTASISEATQHSGPSNTFSFPEEEQKILAFWREIDAFRTSVKLSEGRPRYSFYDGPPFATGLPHYGHILAGTIKDIVTRYAHQTGHYVERRFGWDCHGVPIEHQIDKKFNLKTKEDVMKMGIPEYCNECRKIVMTFAQDWRVTVERTGRWIDFDNDYKTLNADFMESVWWAFKQLFDKGQVYRGKKVMPFSVGLHTPLSNHEAGENYKDVSDPAITVSFPLVNDPSVQLLAWTTTPWTLPSNLALCVNANLTYVKIKDIESGQIYVLMEKGLGVLYKDPKKAKFEVLQKLKGSELKGLKYDPLFKYFYDEFKDRAFMILVDDYVSEDSGTGVVHQAPAFGEDDFRVCMDAGVFCIDGHLPCPIDDAGRFTGQASDFAGQFCKDADKNIVKAVKASGRLVRNAQLVHSYPFCPRSETPLIYKAVPSWFVRITNIIEKMLANNKKSRWVPEAIQEKRFANWLASARDWNVSRNRYWGTPIPLWVSEDFEEVICIGSREELRDLSGCGSLDDIHRDKIDHITIPSKKGKGMLRRVEEVFDCWFESGSMPYAQQHYPFERQKEFTESFPADFVAEGLDQTRGWFYTLTVLATHLFDKPAFKNLIVNGLVLAADGKKMSKRLNNYPPVTEILDKYGADPLRIFLINSPVVRAESLRFSEAGVKDVVSKVFLPWYNAYKFFLAQCLLLEKESNVKFRYNHLMKKSNNVMDRWILAACQSLIRFIKEEMEVYRLYTVIPRLLHLIEELTNWYIRFNRKRLKGENGPEDTVLALNTLFETLYTLCRTMAPFTPFITEHMFQTMRGFHSSTEDGDDNRSIHFVSFPSVRKDYFDPEIERSVGRMQVVIELARVIREQHALPLKTPLRELVVLHGDQQYLDDVASLESYILDELNVRRLVVSSEEGKYGVKYRAEVDFRVLGQKFKKDAMKVKKALPDVSPEAIKEFTRSKRMTVAGLNLVDGDINVIRYYDPAASTVKYESNSEKNENVLVLLDVKRHPELEQEGLAREMVNRIQRARKSHGWVPTDDRDMYYEMEEPADEQISRMLESPAAEYITRIMKRRLEPFAKKPARVPVLASSVEEVNGIRFKLYFTHG